MKLKYSLLERRLGDATRSVAYLQQSDETRFRPILNLEPVPSSYRNPGYGGVDRYREFSGLTYASLIVSSLEKVNTLVNMTKVQEESVQRLLLNVVISGLTSLNILPGYAC